MLIRTLAAISLLMSVLLTGCVDDDYIFPVDAVPTDITVIPADPVRSAGVGEQYTAIATFPDGSQRDITGSAQWRSSDPAVATVVVNSGFVTTIAAGQSTISAEFNGVTGGTSLVVTAGQLTQIQIIPANASEPAGTTRQFNAV